MVGRICFIANYLLKPLNPVALGFKYLSHAAHTDAVEQEIFPETEPVASHFQW